jgi:hypothetical protein
VRRNVKESPDSIDSIDLDFEDEDAIAFGYYRNKMYVSNFEQTHWQMMDIYDIDIPGEEVRFKMKYPGRLWIENKVISFWTYPENKSIMKKLISDLEKELYNRIDKKIDIWNKFKIEVLFSKEKGLAKKWKYDNEIYEYVPEGYTLKIIPLKSYKSSEKRTTKDLSKPHIMSPVAKNSDVPKGMGSEKTPDGLSATQLHQIRRTSDGTIKLKNLVEYTIGKVSKQINVKIDIDKTVHAGQQQNRPEGHTSDTEIIEIVNLALPEIANMLLFDEIDMGDYVLIKHRGTMINIVGALQHGNNGVIDFVVVTVMKKENFMPKKGTKVIEV